MSLFCLLGYFLFLFFFRVNEYALCWQALKQYPVSHNWASGSNICLKPLSLFTLNVIKKRFPSHRLGHNAAAGFSQNGCKRWWVKVLLTTKTVPQRQTKSVEEQSKYLAEKEERQMSLLSAEQLSLICSTEAG